MIPAVIVGLFFEKQISVLFDQNLIYNNVAIKFPFLTKFLIVIGSRFSKI